MSIAQHLADELCMFDNVPESITRFFDYGLLRSRLGIVRTSSALLSLLPQVTTRLLPVRCSCLTLTWAMAMCSAPAKAEHSHREFHECSYFACPILFEAGNG